MSFKNPLTSVHCDSTNFSEVGDNNEALFGLMEEEGKEKKGKE